MSLFLFSCNALEYVLAIQLVPGVFLGVCRCLLDFADRVVLRPTWGGMWRSGHRAVERSRQLLGTGTSDYWCGSERLAVSFCYAERLSREALAARSVRWAGARACSKGRTAWIRDASARSGRIDGFSSVAGAAVRSGAMPIVGSLLVSRSRTVPAELHTCEPLPHLVMANLLLAAGGHVGCGKDYQTSLSELVASLGARAHEARPRCESRFALSPVARVAWSEREA